MAERDGLALDELDDLSVERIRMEIEESKEEISETVEALEEKLRSTFDWREQLARHPLAALGVAAGLGFLLSGLFRRRTSAGERMADAFSELVDEVSHRALARIDDVIPPPPRRPGIVRTAAGLAASRLAVNALSRESERWWRGGRADAGNASAPADGPVGASVRPFE